jgi:hypothetical protein
MRQTIVGETPARSATSAWLLRAAARALLIRSPSVAAKDSSTSVMRRVWRVPLHLDSTGAHHPLTRSRDIRPAKRTQDDRCPSSTHPLARHSPGETDPRRPVPIIHSPARATFAR